MIQKWFKNEPKMVKNGQKMILKWSKSGQKWSKNVSIMVQKWFKMVQKWFENGPKMDHQVDLSAKGSYIITHIGLRAEGAKADSQKHKLDDQQIQLISPIM